MQVQLGHCLLVVFLADFDEDWVVLLTCQLSPPYVLFMLFAKCSD